MSAITVVTLSNGATLSFNSVAGPDLLPGDPNVGYYSVQPFSVQGPGVPFETTNTASAKVEIPGGHFNVGEGRNPPGFPTGAQFECSGLSLLNDSFAGAQAAAISNPSRCVGITIAPDGLRNQYNVASIQQVPEVTVPEPGTGGSLMIGALALVAGGAFAKKKLKGLGSTVAGLFSSGTEAEAPKLQI